MKALSLLQPWASLVVSGAKNIENRRWHLPKAMQGQRFLVHASARLDKREIESARHTLDRVNADTGQTLQMPEKLPLGGIVGIARARTCLCPSESGAEALIHYPWLAGDQHGFVLEDRHALPFVACKGALGFWTVPDDVLRRLGLADAAQKKRRCNNVIPNGSRCPVLLDAADVRPHCQVCSNKGVLHV